MMDESVLIDSAICRDAKWSDDRAKHAALGTLTPLAVKIGIASIEHVLSRNSCTFCTNISVARTLWKNLSILVVTNIANYRFLKNISRWLHVSSVLFWKESATFAPANISSMYSFRPLDSLVLVFLLQPSSESEEEEQRVCVLPSVLRGRR